MRLFEIRGGGGLDDHDFLTTWPTSGCHGQMVLVKGSKIFDHDLGQNFKICVVKIQNWPFLTMTIAEIPNSLKFKNR